MVRVESFLLGKGETTGKLRDGSYRQQETNRNLPGMEVVTKKNEVIFGVPYPLQKAPVYQWKPSQNFMK